MASQEPDKSWHPINTKIHRAAVATYLVTPPENIVESFSQRDENEEDERVVEGWQEAVQNKLPPIQSHTPPTSPEINELPSLNTATGFPRHDSPLFPEVDRARSQTPLFENDRSQTPSPARYTSHVDAPKLSIRTTLAEPYSGIYPANLGVTTPDGALRYYNDRMEELRRIRAYKLPTPKTSTSAGRDELSIRQLHSLTRKVGVTKSRSAPKPASKPKAPAVPSPAKSSPPKRRTPKRTSYTDFVDSAFPSAQADKRHKRAPPSKKVEQAGKNWTELPDYAPPTSTLDSNSKPLKANWRGQLLSMDDDKDRAHCHPQELNVCSALRLSCAVYLTNKRKIFRARLEYLKQGKNFTKTAAQGACGIDVNKTSQLWEAFERVGWFKESWFEQYL